MIIETRIQAQSWKPANTYNLREQSNCSPDEVLSECRAFSIKDVFTFWSRISSHEGTISFYYKFLAESLGFTFWIPGTDNRIISEQANPLCYCKNGGLSRSNMWQKLTEISISLKGIYRTFKRLVTYVFVFPTKLIAALLYLLQLAVNNLSLCNLKTVMVFLTLWGSDKKKYTFPLIDYIGTYNLETDMNLHLFADNYQGQYENRTLVRLCITMTDTVDYLN
jgi:hypothetical protein